MKFFLLVLLCSTGLVAETVQLPKGIDHRAYDSLLGKYVDDQGLVDYQGWKASSADMGILKEYLKQFGPTGNPASGEEEIAGLLNAYNAFTLNMILENYPTNSIRLLDDPFKRKAHLMGGRKVSLDEIEQDTLRPLIGWNVHALVVCAARSCPPLASEGFSADTWEDQMQERYRVWFAREDLTEFAMDSNRVEISKIFDWYKKDFEGDDSIKNILLRFGPESKQAFLSEETYKVIYKTYHWGLNDQSDVGKDYKHSIFKLFF